MPEFCFSASPCRGKSGKARLSIKTLKLWVWRLQNKLPIDAYRGETLASKEGEQKNETVEQMMFHGSILHQKTLFALQVFSHTATIDICPLATKQLLKSYSELWNKIPASKTIKQSLKFFCSLCKKIPRPKILPQGLQ